ncbi:MAG TPA: OB-fold nucleic acid binding domain-containing protein, partial [Patescibacteria group bacterium]|nr:OB-fold nucleic acid binding domain-containing protein [Patescibacteria group bacterium]
ELLGFYLTEHPLSNVLSLLSSQSTHKVGWLQEENVVGKRITIGGIISTLRKTFTKNGNNEMAFCAIEDETGAIEAVVFPKVFAKTKDVWVVDQIVLLTGRVEYKDETLSFLVESAKTFSEEDAKETKRRVEIKVPKGTPVELLKDVNTIFRENPGKDTIVIIVENGGGVIKRLVLPYGVNYTVNLARQIASLLKQL